MFQPFALNDLIDWLFDKEIHMAAILPVRNLINGLTLYILYSGKRYFQGVPENKKPASIILTKNADGSIINSRLIA